MPNAQEEYDQPTDNSITADILQLLPTRASGNGAKWPK